MSRDQSANQHIEYAQDRIRQACLDRDPAAFFECVTVEIITAQDHSRAESDLDAQQAMALWAKLMTVASLLGLGITTLGVYLVWGTLVQTKTATSAAQKAVAVTREMGERQIRAYLSIMNITGKIGPIGVAPEFNLSVKNTGQSPARECKVRADVFLTAGYGDQLKIRISEPFPSQSRSEVAAGDASAVMRKFQATMTNDHRFGIKNGQITVVFAGLVIYKDVFGKTRRATFKLNSIAAAIGSDIINFRYCSRGNKSS